MKKIIGFIFAFIFSIFTLTAKDSFLKIEGPEKSYNQIRIVNESSITSFKCRVSILKDLGNGKFEKDFVYGIYTLDGDGDTDSITNKINRGKYFVVEFEEKDKDKFSYYVDYQDNPFFDVVRIHVVDKSEQIFEQKI